MNVDVIVDDSVMEDNCMLSDSECEKSSVQSPSSPNCVSNASSSSGHATNSAKVASLPIREKKTQDNLIFTFEPDSSHIVIKRQKRVYRCDVCLQSYLHSFSLKRHFMRNHVSIQYISQSDINNCKINVKRRMAVENVSDFAYNNPSSRRPSSEKDQALEMKGLYRCNFCKGITFDLREEVRLHYKIHISTLKSLFTCEKCKVTFPDKQALSQHLKSHSGTASFPCTICGKAFGNKSLYLKHNAIHTDGRTCKHCDRVFSTKANRCRHERKHAGLKPYSCKHCSTQFTQSMDLKKHIRKSHAMLYVACAMCSSLFSSKTALNKHISDKHGGRSQPHHSDIIGSGHTSCKVQKTPPSDIIRSASSSSTQNGKQSASACDKNTSSYSTLDYKNPAHPSDRPVKYQTRQQTLNHELENVQLSEEDFYKSLSSRIADNLLNHIDGRASQLSLKQYDVCQPDQLPQLPSLEWSKYNFPSSFNVEQFLKVKGQEVPVSIVQLNSPNADDVLSENDYPEVNKDAAENSYSDCDISDSDIMPFSCKKYADYKNIDFEERKKLIGRTVNSILLCSVCKETLPNHQAFLDHNANNHPNVQGSYIEIEGEKDSPPVIPEEMQRQFLSPVGVYFTCNVPPPIEESGPIKCSKCQQPFTSSPDFYHHIILCAGGSDKVTSTYAHKSFFLRKIKRTMKHRFSASCYERRFGYSRSRHRGFVSYNKTKLKSTSNGHKPSVGRPKSNSSICCPQCNQSFKTKALLGIHISRSHKKLMSKKQYLTMKKTEAYMGEKNLPESLKMKNSALCKQSATCAQGVTKLAVSSESGELSSSPETSSPVERLSPSLEVLVNSIKEKLTAEELSPANPTFSWMEDDGFIAASHNSPPSVKSGDEAHQETLQQPLNKPSSAFSEKSCRRESIDGLIDTSDTCDDPCEEGSCTEQITLQSGSDKVSIKAFIGERQNQTPSSDEGTTKPKPESLCNAERIIPTQEPLKRKPNPQKYKPKVNPYVKKRRRKRSKILKAMAGEPLSVSQGVKFEEALTTSEVCDKLVPENSVEQTLELPCTSPSPVLPSSALISQASTSKATYTTADASSSKISLQFREPSATPSVSRSQNDQGKSLRCPFCMADFAYVTTFHRHIKSCQVKKIKEEEETQESSSSSPRLLLIPKKDEVEESMLNLFRNQHRQSEMMKEIKSEDSNDVRSFQTYTCGICHKIFLSLFKLLVHRVDHKLHSTGDPSETQASSSSNGNNAATPVQVPEPSPSGVPALKISTLEHSPVAGPSSAPACLQTAHPPEISSHSSTPSNVLHLEIPTSSGSLSQPGPSSAPIHLAAKEVWSPSSSNIFKSSSLASLDSKNNEQKPLTKPIITKAQIPNDAQKSDQGPEAIGVLQNSNVQTNGTPPSEDGTSVSKGPPLKRRKKIKKLVVRKHGHLKKGQLPKRANKVVQIKLESNDSSHTVVTNHPEADVDDPPVSENVVIISTMTTTTVEESSSILMLSPNNIPKRSKSKPSTSDKSCSECGKVFSSSNYRKRHMMLKHSGLFGDVKLIFQQSTIRKKKAALKKKLQKKRIIKRSALQRLCKTKFIPNKKLLTLKQKK